MSSTNELLNRINEKYRSFSKRERLLAAYITDNYDKAVFLTAARLGNMVGVSESTVVRFATHLGYKGYSELQYAIEELARSKSCTINRTEDIYRKMSQSELLETVLQSDIKRIKETLEKMESRVFEMAVDTILSARHIYVIGIRSCTSLAEFLAFYLNMIFEDVRLIHTSSSSELLEQMVHICNEDVIIGISFPRYSIRTLKAIEFANSRNAKVITLSDNIHSPINLYSSCNLIAKSNMSSMVDSLVAPLSVINALIMAIFMKKQGDVIKNLETLEQIWEEYQVYGKDEIDYIANSSPPLI